MVGFHDRAFYLQHFYDAPDTFGMLAEYARAVRGRWRLPSERAGVVADGAPRLILRFASAELGRLVVDSYLYDGSEDAARSVLVSFVFGAKGNRADIEFQASTFIDRDREALLACEPHVVFEMAAGESAARALAARACARRRSEIISRAMLDADAEAGRRPKGREGPYPGGWFGWLRTATIAGDARWEPVDVDDPECETHFRGEMKVMSWRTPGPWKDRELGLVRCAILLTTIPSGGLKLWSFLVEEAELEPAGDLRYEWEVAYLARSETAAAFAAEDPRNFPLTLLTLAVEWSDLSDVEASAA